MELSAQDAARMLSVCEESIYRWIRDRALPTHLVQHQYRFNRVELQEWAAANGHSIAADGHGPGGTLSVADAIARGGIHARIAGRRYEDVLRAIALLPCIPELDRKLLCQLLLAREAPSNTCIGRGIALPHPRDPLVLRVREPHVALCFLAEPLDLGAPDGLPVRILFLLLSPSVHAHLEILARLARALQDDVLQQLLSPTEEPRAIIDRIRAIEAERARP